VSIRPDIEVFAIGQYGPALCTSNGLYKVEREGAGLSDRSQVTAFVLSARALTGVFQQDEAVFLTNSQEGVQVGHGAAHMHRHDTFGPGSNGLPYSGRIKGQRAVHIHEYGYGAYAEHGF